MKVTLFDLSLLKHLADIAKKGGGEGVQNYTHLTTQGNLKIDYLNGLIIIDLKQVLEVLKRKIETLSQLEQMKLCVCLFSSSPYLLHLRKIVDI